MSAMWKTSVAAVLQQLNKVPQPSLKLLLRKGWEKRGEVSRWFLPPSSPLSATKTHSGLDVHPQQVRSHLYTQLEDRSDIEGGLQTLCTSCVWSVKLLSSPRDAGRGPSKRTFIPLNNRSYQRCYICHYNISLTGWSWSHYLCSDGCTRAPPSDRRPSQRRQRPLPSLVPPASQPQSLNTGS